MHKLRYVYLTVYTCIMMLYSLETLCIGSNILQIWYTCTTHGSNRTENEVINFSSYLVSQRYSKSRQYVYPSLSFVNYIYKMRGNGVLGFAISYLVLEIFRFFTYIRITTEWRHLLKYELKYNFKIDTLERTCVYCHILFQITELFNVLSTQNEFYQTCIFSYSKWHSASF